MNEMLGEMGPALAALAVAGFIAALALTIRRQMIGDLTKRAQQAQLQAAQRNKPKSAILAAPAPPRRDISLAAVHEAVPDFQLSTLLDHAHDWFVAVQVARGSGETGDLEEHLMSGALDMAMASGPGLESTGRTWVLFTQPLKIGGSADGCRALIRIRALIEETRNGDPTLVEIDESWSFGWAPAHGRWRVLQVEHNWRRLLEPPHLNPDAEPPAKRARPHEDLERDGAEVDLDAVVAAAMLVAPEWAAAAQANEPGRLEGLATATFGEAVAGWHARRAHFGVAPSWSLEVDEVVPVRVLLEPDRQWVTVRITGTSTVALSPEALEGEAESLTSGWSSYATFRSESEGRWLLAWAVDDEDWVVSPELPG